MKFSQVINLDRLWQEVSEPINLQNIKLDIKVKTAEIHQLIIKEDKHLKKDLSQLK